MLVAFGKAGPEEFISYFHFPQEEFLAHPLVLQHFGVSPWKRMMSRQLLVTLFGFFASIQLIFAQEPEGNLQFFTLVVYLFIRINMKSCFSFTRIYQLGLWAIR